MYHHIQDVDSPIITPIDSNLAIFSPSALENDLLFKLDRKDCVKQRSREAIDLCLTVYQIMHKKKVFMRRKDCMTTEKKSADGNDKHEECTQHMLNIFSKGSLNFVHCNMSYKLIVKSGTEDCYNDLTFSHFLIC